MDDHENFNEYYRTILSSRNIMYSILTLLEQQEQTLEHLAITTALRRRVSQDSQHQENASDSEANLQGPRQRRRRIYRRSVLQSPIASSIRFRIPPVENEIYSDPERYTTSPPSRTPLPQPTTNPISNLFTQAIINSLGQLNPVRVTPSASQIEEATETLTFGELPSDISRYQSCPICHDTFTSDSNILRINHCGHYFSRNAILTWFGMNCHCPICRHDIREGLSPASSEDNNEIHDEEISQENTTVNNISDLGLSTFLNAISQDIQRRGARNQSTSLQYSFEFIPTTSDMDTSGNVFPPDNFMDPSGNVSSPDNYTTSYLDLSGNVPPPDNYTTSYLDLSGNVPPDNFMDPSGNVFPPDNYTTSYLDLSGNVPPDNYTTSYVDPSGNIFILQIAR